MAKRRKGIPREETACAKARGWEHSQLVWGRGRAGAEAEARVLNVLSASNHHQRDSSKQDQKDPGIPSDPVPVGWS